MDITLLFNRIIRIKLVRFIIVPFLLLFIWPLFSFVFVPRQSLTTIEEKFTIDKSKIPVKKIAHQYKIKSEFKANYNHLGTILIHQSVITDHLESTDRLIFHIKEKSKDSWYYEALYDSGFFNSNRYFPFGFPIMKDSKDKTYEFEVISLFSVDIIDISKNNPEYIAKYKYSPKEMIENKKLRTIMFKNLIYNFQDKQFLRYSSIFLLPLFFYLFYLFNPKAFYLRMVEYPEKSFFFLRFKKTFVIARFAEFPKDLLILALIFFSILYDVIFISSKFYGIFLGLLVLLIIFYIKNKIHVVLSLFFTFFFFLLSEIYIIFNLKPELDKASIWVYTFLCISFIQSLLRHKK